MSVLHYEDEEYKDEWIEETDYRINTCTINLEAYVNSRKDDDSSLSSNNSGSQLPVFSTSKEKLVAEFIAKSGSYTNCLEHRNDFHSIAGTQHGKNRKDGIEIKRQETHSLYPAVKVKSTLSNYMENLQMYNKPRFEPTRTEVSRDQTSSLQHPNDGPPSNSLRGILVPSGIHQRDQYASPQASLRGTNIEQNVITNSVNSWIDTPNI